ncbi:hypothetical protein B0H15DRAFT_841245 [Mycena belliarum]|uniref:Cupin type-2 domain-containing protein n=1 Tax=Mycena belliarum TaxID=1033014 RepID=A0AAD6U7X7_9AGAR|nr:hypothetical protein B0H15DRAFT_841245 [Mycena belliae]
MTSPQSPFPPVRRVVTGHTSEGKSTVLADTALPQRFWTPQSIAPVYDIHYTGEAPAVIDTEISKGKWVDEIVHHPELTSAGGSTFRCWDFAPGQISPAHRTTTLDYAIVFRGTVILELDDGERVTLKEGDTVIQRGTMHTWRNESTEWAKVYFVMLGAKTIEVGGKALGEESHAAR